MEDLDAITELWVQLAREQRQYGSHLHAEDNRDPLRMTLASAISNDGLHVTRQDSSVVGFVSFGIEDGALVQDVTRGVVRNIFVHPDHRRSGLGTALLESAEATLKDRGAEVIRLEAMAQNDDATEFYREQGYDPHRIVFERHVGSDTHSKGDDER